MAKILQDQCQNQHWITTTKTGLTTDQDQYCHSVALGLVLVITVPQSQLLYFNILIFVLYFNLLSYAAVLIVILIS